MTINLKANLLLLCLFLSNPFGASAQMDDLQLRSQIGLTYSPAKRWDVNASFRYDLNQYIQAFRRSNFTIGVSHQLNKHIEVGGSYRFMTSYSQDIHRFRLYVSADKKINKKLNLSARTLLQHDINYFQWDYLQQYNPKWVLRERVALKYEPAKKWKFVLYTEPFISYRDAELSNYRWRNGLQASYLYKKRHEIGAGFFWQHGMAQNAGKDIGVFLIQYTFDLNKPKAKKKKKST